MSEDMSPTIRYGTVGEFLYLCTEYRVVRRTMKIIGICGNDVVFGDVRIVAFTDESHAFGVAYSGGFFECFRGPYVPESR